MEQNIRIFNGCSVQIENSVTRVTARHHEPLMMPNSYPCDGIFSLHRTTITDSFSCTLSSTIVIKLEYVLFYQFYAKNSTLSIKKCSVRLLSTSWRHAQGRLTPPGTRRKYPERVKITEKLVGYARNSFLAYPMEISLWLASVRKCYVKVSFVDISFNHLQHLFDIILQALWYQQEIKKKNLN